MPTKWQEKGVGVSLRRGSSNVKRVVDERDGSTAGKETEHWDDSRDAVALVKGISVKAKREER